MKYLLFGAVLFSFSISFGQSKEGFWDTSRSTNETILISAGKRKVIKTYDFPVGTTEVVYRISLVDDNQKITSSLVSLLKSIPDPTGISQGTAGALFLASTITGDDKCKFAVFTTEKDALNYEKTGIARNACIVQEEPVNKAANLLSEKSKCLNQNSGTLWFGFQSDNWVMKEKIILEVVPWINNNLRSGWTTEKKKEILALGQKTVIAQKVANKELFLGNFVSAFVAKYSYYDYNTLLHVEKAKVVDDLAEESLQKSGQLSSFLEAVRDEANELELSDDSTAAITMIQKEIIDRGRAVADDYFFIGKIYLSTKQFVRAEEALLKAVEMNKSNVNYHHKLAHVYMFTDRLSKAKDSHQQLKNNNLDTTKSWNEQTKIDFETFRKNGFDTENFKKILRILN